LPSRLASASRSRGCSRQSSRSRQASPTHGSTCGCTIPSTCSWGRQSARGVPYPCDVLGGAASGRGMGLASVLLTHVARQWWDPVTPVLATESAGTNQLILVVSPHAGNEDKLAKAKRLIAARGLDVVAEIAVDDLHRLPDLLRSNGSRPPIVVAVGGDGTVGAVARAGLPTPPAPARSP